MAAPIKRTTFPSINHGKNSTANRDWHTNCNWYIQEKIDGSQFSFSVHETEGDRKMIFTCGNNERTASASMFKKAIDVLNLLKEKLMLDWVYHAEMLTSTRQNIVDYDRMPHNFVVVYDISHNGEYMDITDITYECNRLSLEVVPAIYVNSDPHINAHMKCIDLVNAIGDGELRSMFGGTPEGVVLKCPNFRTDQNQVNLKLKYVTPKFQEVRHVKKSTKKKQSVSEYIAWIGTHFDLEARFAKGRQHLANRKDIPADETPEYRALLIEELDEDLVKEHSIIIRSFLDNEYSSWTNPRNEIVHSSDPLWHHVHGVSTQEVYNFLLPYVLSASRASL